LSPHSEDKIAFTLKVLYSLKYQAVIFLKDRYRKESIFIEKLIKNRKFNKKPDFNRVIK